MDRGLLILDLDETLISSTEQEPPFGFDFKVFHYFVKKRPHLDEFLRAVQQWYDLAVWSSAGDEYVDQIVGHVFGGESELRFVWARSRCTQRSHLDTASQYFAKNLKKVVSQGFSLQRVLIIDDSAESVERHFGNHIRLQGYRGQASDRELLCGLPFLEWLSGEDNFRAIEKRGWRSFA